MYSAGQLVQFKKYEAVLQQEAHFCSDITRSPPPPFFVVVATFRSGILWTQKLKTDLLRTQSSKVLLLSLGQVRI